MYNAPSTGGQRFQKKIRGTTTEHDDAQSTQINLFTGDESRPMLGKISQKEKDRRFKEKLCFYCGKKNHMAKECRAKQSKQGNTSRRDTKTRGLTAQDDSPDSNEQPSPSYEDTTHVSRFYHANPYDILRPKSAPVNEDF
jgi:hypothetical protein